MIRIILEPGEAIYVGMMLPTGRVVQVRVAHREIGDVHLLEVVGEKNGGIVMKRDEL